MWTTGKPTPAMKLQLIGMRPWCLYSLRLCQIDWQTLKLICLFGLLANFSALGSASGPVCANCHPEETARYLGSPMGNSLVVPAPLPPGTINHRQSGSVITIEQTPQGL